MKRTNPPHLNLEERRKIKELHDKGLKGTAISQQLGRGKNTVIVELRRFHGRTYNPEIAQKEADERIIKRNESTADTLRKNPMPNPYQALLKRIECLEMHVQILKDVIKEIKE